MSRSGDRATVTRTRTRRRRPITITGIGAFWPMCVLITAVPVCVFIAAVSITKLFSWGGGGDDGGHVLRETTSRGLCGLVCPSRTSERGGEGDCVKEGGGGEGERERERALGLLLCYSP
jgi:hypothetical protein